MDFMTQLSNTEEDASRDSANTSLSQSQFANHAAPDLPVPASSTSSGTNGSSGSLQTPVVKSSVEESRSLPSEEPPLTGGEGEGCLFFRDPCVGAGLRFDGGSGICEEAVSVVDGLGSHSASLDGSSFGALSVTRPSDEGGSLRVASASAFAVPAPPPSKGVGTRGRGRRGGRGRARHGYFGKSRWQVAAERAASAASGNDTSLSMTSHAPPAVFAGSGTNPPSEVGLPLREAPLPPQQQSLSLARGDIKKFSTLTLIPGQPRKWRRVLRRVGNAKVPVWEAIPETEDALLGMMKHIIQRGPNGQPLRRSRAAAAAAALVVQQQLQLRDTLPPPKMSLPTLSQCTYIPPAVPPLACSVPGTPSSSTHILVQPSASNPISSKGESTLCAAQPASLAAPPPLSPLSQDSHLGGLFSSEASAVQGNPI